MEIFDLLCANHTDNAQSVVGISRETRRSTAAPGYQGGESTEFMTDKYQAHGDIDNNNAYGLSWEMIQGEFTGGMDNYLLKPKHFTGGC